jgi:hypothetical protein
VRDLTLAIAAGVMLGLGALAASRVAYGQQTQSTDRARTDARALVHVVHGWQRHHDGACPTVTELKSDRALIQEHPSANDPWGNPYVVFCPHDTDLGVLSAGSDGRYGTADDIKAGDVP